MSKEELEKQFEEVNEARNKKIIESGSYIRFTIVIGDDNMIVPKVEARKFSSEMMTKAIITLEQLAQELRDRYPLASIATNFYGAEGETYERTVGDEE